MEKVKLQAQYGLYINGQWRNASDGATYNAESPADGSHLACLLYTSDAADD